MSQLTAISTPAKSPFIGQIKELLELLLSEESFSKTFEEGSAGEKFLNEKLPFIKWIEDKTSLSVILLTKHRKGVSSFFYEMISRHLSPEKELHIEHFFSSDFYFKERRGELYTIAHITLLKDEESFAAIQKNLQAVETEIRLGAISDYHARRILEFKGLSFDGKTAMIQEKIGSLMQARSQDYDKSIFAQMQRFLVTCKEEFKNVRDYHHISRIISVLYLIRKTLDQKMRSFPKERHFVVKFLKTKLHKNNETKSVLAVLVGLNFLKDHEIFEKKHLMSAIKSYVPSAEIIEGSDILEKSQNSPMQTLYLEIEKKDGSEFTLEEIQSLRFAMPEHLKGHIEHLMHPIFMPRNEEEVLRNIMILSKQLKYVQDIPQVIITFDEQKGEELLFTVILLRVLKQDSLPIEEIANSLRKKMDAQIERLRRVGFVRRKYPKEASVFRLSIPMQRYLRMNHSVDLYKARGDILKEYMQIFRDVRDYNGGMIYKQNEVFKKLKAKLGEISHQEEFLLEKFFFALSPIEMRSIVSSEHLKGLFLLLKSGSKEPLLIKQDSKKVALIIQKKEAIVKAKETVKKMNLSSHMLLSFELEGPAVLGYLLLSEDVKEQKRFIQMVNKVFANSKLD